MGKSLEGFFYVLVPTLLLIMIYILLHRRITTFETSVDELLKSHIPDIVYIDNSETIKTEFINAVNVAEKFIMTTGGKSRIKEYLLAIEKRLEETDIEYYRVISGDKISNDLYEHLKRVIEREGVYLSYAPELTTTLLVTEKIAFLGLPTPKPFEFKTCLKIPDDKIINSLGKYIRTWYYTKKASQLNRESLELIERN